MIARYGGWWWALAKDDNTGWQLLCVLSLACNLPAGVGQGGNNTGWQPPCVCVCVCVSMHRLLALALVLTTLGGSYRACVNVPF